MLYEELLNAYLEEAAVESLLQIKKEVILDRSYQALSAIRDILDDSCLDDCACFEKIERIVSVYESLGVHTTRHDFG